MTMVVETMVRRRVSYAYEFRKRTNFVRLPICTYVDILPVRGRMKKYKAKYKDKYMSFVAEVATFVVTSGSAW